MPYRWDLGTAALTFTRAGDCVMADICVIGTVSPQWSGGRPEGLEMLAIAGRIQNASGGFVDEAEDLTLRFTPSHFRVRPRTGSDHPAAG